MDYNAPSLARQLAGWQIHLLDEVTSTQDVARQLVDEAAEDSSSVFVSPAIIVAHQQTGGRGRGSKRWFANEGSIAVTFVMDAPGDCSPLELPLRTGLAVRDALSPWLDLARVQIKWPNDVLVSGKKIAGVLCERRQNRDLIGIGLNVTLDPSLLDETIAARSTSLREHLGHDISTCPTRQEVLIAIADQMKQLWTMPDWLGTLNRVHALTEQDINVHTPDGPLAGVCEGIDAQGCLLLRTGQRVHHLLDGTIEK